MKTRKIPMTIPAVFLFLLGSFQVCSQDVNSQDQRPRPAASSGTQQNSAKKQIPRAQPFVIPGCNSKVSYRLDAQETQLLVQRLRQRYPSTTEQECKAVVSVMAQNCGDRIQTFLKLDSDEAVKDRRNEIINQTQNSGIGDFLISMAASYEIAVKSFVNPAARFGNQSGGVPASADLLKPSGPSAKESQLLEEMTKQAMEAVTMAVPRSPEEYIGELSGKTVDIRTKKGPMTLRFWSNSATDGTFVYVAISQKKGTLYTYRFPAQPGYKESFRLPDADEFGQRTLVEYRFTADGDTIQIGGVRSFPISLVSQSRKVSFSFKTLEDARKTFLASEIKAHPESIISPLGAKKYVPMFNYHSGLDVSLYSTDDLSVAANNFLLRSCEGFNCKANALKPLEFAEVINGKLVQNYYLPRIRGNEIVYDQSGPLKEPPKPEPSGSKTTLPKNKEEAVAFCKKLLAEKKDQLPEEQRVFCEQLVAEAAAAEKTAKEKEWPKKEIDFTDGTNLKLIEKFEGLSSKFNWRLYKDGGDKLWLVKRPNKFIPLHVDAKDAEITPYGEGSGLVLIRKRDEKAKETDIDIYGPDLSSDSVPKVLEAKISRQNLAGQVQKQPVRTFTLHRVDLEIMDLVLNLLKKEGFLNDDQTAAVRKAIDNANSKGWKLTQAGLKLDENGQILMGYTDEKNAPHSDTVYKPGQKPAASSGQGQKPGRVAGQAPAKKQALPKDPKETGGLTPCVNCSLNAKTEADGKKTYYFNFTMPNEHNNAKTPWGTDKGETPLGGQGLENENGFIIPYGLIQEAGGLKEFLKKYDILGPSQPIDPRKVKIDWWKSEKVLGVFYRDENDGNFVCALVQPKGWTPPGWLGQAYHWTKRNASNVRSADRMPGGIIYVPKIDPFLFLQEPAPKQSPAPPAAPAQEKNRGKKK